MAMLAAPRRKQKVINLRAKNSAWSNDGDKFGQKMLEKMGWSAGKGLGAKEDGIVEHVIARYKNDDRGLGYEDRNDQWTKHEDDFNALLANLSNGEVKEEKDISGVSLEVKSKSSKARVHYHKFTRGKDLTRYSKKDLANIFGKKSLDKTELKKEDTKEDIKTTEQVFTEKGSMEDYFKSKLAAFKNKVPLSNDKESDDERDYSFRGFSNGDTEQQDGESNQNVGFQSFSFYNHKPEITPEQENIENVDKKQKKKKNKLLEQENVDLVTETADDITEVPEKRKSKKKKKAEKESPSAEQEPEMIEPETPQVPDEPKRKKKKSKHAASEEIENLEQKDIDDHVPKKKKKRKHENNM